MSNHHRGIRRESRPLSQARSSERPGLMPLPTVAISTDNVVSDAACAAAAAAVQRKTNKVHWPRSYTNHMPLWCAAADDDDDHNTASLPFLKREAVTCVRMRTRDR